ncbi:sigma-70 family RNA polymerase sigma factor [Streptomyces prasinus]|uniref:sigma-70 family RNA polymerase sigma factor n=1 Tax=Streptomyces prasinus TaxID=67345 RepID=UPI0033A7CD1F
MTADVKAGTPAALRAELLAAAGPERVLSPMALRRVLVGRDKAVIAEALRLALQDGITLPPAVATSFGVPTDGPTAPAPAPSGPDRPSPARPPREEPAPPGLPAIPAQRAPGPRFTIELGPDSRLDLAALTVRTLRPASPSPTPTPEPPAPRAPNPPARPAVDAADAAFEDSGTSRPVFNSLKYYSKTISRYPLLSRQQEAELAQAIEAGLLAREKLDEVGRKIAPKLRRELEQLALLGEQAFTEFAQANLRLVVSIALKYTKHGLDLLDLIQEGNIGMLHTIKLFDYRKGFKFSTYTVNAIHRAIQRALADQSRTVRLPVHAHDTLAMLHKAARELGRERPADALPEVAARAGVPPDKAADLLSQVRRTVPFEELIEAIGDDVLHEEADRSVQGPHWTEPDTYYLDLSPATVHALLDRLSWAEARVLSLRHGLDGGDGLTLQAVGQEMGVSRERIRQIEKTGTEKLRELVETHRASTTGGRSDAPAVPVPGAPSSPPRSSRNVPRGYRKLRLREERTVYASGHIMIDRRRITVGTQFHGKRVTVLLEDGWFRVIYEGRQVAAVPRSDLIEND